MAAGTTVNEAIEAKRALPQHMTGARWQHLPQRRIVLWRWLWLMLLAFVLAEVQFLPHSHVPHKAYLVTLAAAVILLGHLLYPAQALAPLAPGWRALLWSLLVAAGGLLLMLLQPTSASNLIQTVRLAIAIFAISFAWHGLNRLVATFSGETLAPALTLMAGIVLSATPLWLGPWVADAGAGQFLTDSVIAISPLTYLAVMADYDYLRSDWFYLQTPFGALRYLFPSATLLTGGYTLLGLACLALSSRRLAGHGLACPPNKNRDSNHGGPNPQGMNAIKWRNKP